MKKKVLLTNFNMVNYSGSELDTLTVANYFLSKNYDVTIFTIEAGYPLLNEIDEKIKIIECVESHRLENHYDLIWSHHYPLLDYLLFIKKIAFDHVAYISLSLYEPYETIPPYYKDLDYVSILSKEGLDGLKEDGYDISNINILGNYSFKKYFDGKRKNLNKKIKKICVVSNHVPKEIIECKKIFETNNVQFDIYGKEYKYVKVDDKLLKQYDVVISIGKTIYYGLSLKMPVYIYDHFGGDGYIKEDNIEKSHYYNFSGRYSRIKYTGNELYNDIVKNYDAAVNSAEYNYNYAYKNFCFEEQMNKIINQINSKKQFNINIINNNYQMYIKISGLFMREMINVYRKYNIINGDLKRCKVYYDYGKDFLEKDSCEIYYKKKNNKYYANIYIDKKVKKIKFDFTYKDLVKLISIKINNKKIKFNHLIHTIRVCNFDISYNNNPSIIISDFNYGMNNIEIEMENISSEFILKYSNEKECEIIEYNQRLIEKDKKIEKIEKELRIVNEQIIKIHNNLIYKIIHKLKLIR